MMSRWLSIFVSLSILMTSNLVFAVSNKESYIDSPKKKERIVNLAIGNILDGHYNIGRKLCKYISESNPGTVCRLRPTSGSLESLKLLKNGDVDFAITLSGIALQMYEGSGYFSTQAPFKAMSQLLNLHDSYFTVITKDSDHITNFSGLNGKRISNGPSKSDSSVAYLALEAYYDFPEKPVDVEQNYEDYAHSFCNGDIDAIMMMTSHPNILVETVTNKCESDFISIDPDKINLLIESHPAFHEAKLTGFNYPGITRDEDTVAMPVILIAHNDLSRDILPNFMKYTKERLENLKESDAALYDLPAEHFLQNFILPAAK